MQVALQPEALGVAAGHDAGAGLAQRPACPHSSSRVVCRAASSRALWIARPTCRASSVRTRSSSSVKLSAAGGPLGHDQAEQLGGMLTRRDPDLGLRPAVQQRGSQTVAQALPETPARVTTGAPEP